MRIGSAFAIALTTTACIHPPDVVMVDRATALEQQAGGSFDDLERKLSRTSIEARPVPLTPKQFEELGIKPLPLSDAAEMTDADRVDGLLVQHCIGEGRDGLLADTHAACVGADDRTAALQLIETVNQARLQLWTWLQTQRSDASVDDIRRTWHAVHLKNVACGGWVEGEPGKWNAKQC